jgi:hypothetical protein
MSELAGSRGLYENENEQFAFGQTIEISPDSGGEPGAARDVSKNRDTRTDCTVVEVFWRVSDYCLLFPPQTRRGWNPFHDLYVDRQSLKDIDLRNMKSFIKC